jgi:hypothetical protein
MISLTRITRIMAEQRLDHVNRGVGVEVLGGEHAAAVVRGQDQRGPLCQAEVRHPDRCGVTF